MDSSGAGPSGTPPGRGSGGRPPSSRSKSHVCTICGRSSDRPSALKTHNYTHTGERPFACKHPNCASRFSTPSNAYRHERSCPQARRGTSSGSAEAVEDIASEEDDRRDDTDPLTQVSTSPGSDTLSPYHTSPPPPHSHETERASLSGGHAPMAQGSSFPPYPSPPTPGRLDYAAGGYSQVPAAQYATRQNPTPLLPPLGRANSYTDTAPYAPYPASPASPTYNADYSAGPSSATQRGGGAQWHSPPSTFPNPNPQAFVPSPVTPSFSGAAYPYHHLPPEDPSRTIPPTQPMLPPFPVQPQQHEQPYMYYYPPQAQERRNRNPGEHPGLINAQFGQGIGPHDHGGHGYGVSVPQYYDDNVEAEDEEEEEEADGDGHAGHYHQSARR